MRRVLVTGANKGIGFAIAKGILQQQKDTFLLLGSRDRKRGQQAVDALIAEHPELRERVQLLEIDVSDDASVKRAAQAVAEQFGGSGSLYGVVNNAGIGGREYSLEQVLQVNTRGVHRVCEAFLPLIESGGRIVNVTSAAGPNFVERCSDERKRFFLDPNTDWPALDALMKECVAIEGNEAEFEKRGLGDGAAYGLSKACANTYTQHLAKQHPELRINACTPGFIETDLTRSHTADSGKTPEELGMKPPEAGAKAPLYLLFGDPPGNGRYYGSDAQRSPMDRYRSPGSPEYTGD